MLVPLNDRVVIAIQKPSEELSSGLVHPAADCGPWQLGKVVAVGPGLYLPGSIERAPMVVKVGDMVVTKWRLGEPVNGDYRTQVIREPGVALILDHCCGTCRDWRCAEGEDRGKCEGFDGTGEVLGQGLRAVHGADCIGWETRPGLVA